MDQNSQMSGVSSQISAVLKEISDIKTNLAVNTNETTNIKGDVSEVKDTLKIIQLSSVTREELNDKLKTINKSIDKLWAIVYAIGGVIGLSLLGAILNAFIKKSP